MAESRRLTSPNATLPSTSLWSKPAQVSPEREPLISSEPEHSTSTQSQIQVPALREGGGSTIPGATMSLTSAASGVKGRHTFHHAESHRQIPANPDSPAAPLTSANIPPQSGSPSKDVTNAIVRVDSKDRWRSEGWYTVQQSTAKSSGAQRLISWLVPDQALLSGVAYCVSSCSMILLNKLVLSGYHWEAQICLLIYQNLVSITVVLVCSMLGLIQVEPLTWKLVAVWFPVNIIFVGMLITSFFSLQYMQVAMVTILKNVTNLLTAVGEMYLFRKRHSVKVWGSLFLMILSAVCGGFTDLSFHPAGYTWQAFNCLFTAAYSLVLRRVMDVAKSSTRSGTLSEFSMVLLNAALSFPPAILMVLLFGELDFILNSPLMLNPGFWFICTLSGLLGLAISFTSMWFLHQTSPTTYSLVGSLNKIPLSILGIIIFNAPTSVANVSSILFGCFAGVVFARAKMAG